MKLRIAALCMAACTAATAVHSQTPAQTPANPPPACPSAETLGTAHLYGQWRAQIDGEPDAANVQFLKDPEQDDSLVGSINRAAAKGKASKPALLAGEMQQGEFNLEESDDGVRISATWSGQVVDASCGKEIRGLWTNALDNQTHAFVLRRLGGWQ